MPRVRLVCWNAGLADERRGRLEGTGWEIDASAFQPSGFVGQLKQQMPDVVLIDLERLPSHGREVATAIRNSPSLRHLPLVFAGGAPEKVEVIRASLPDAVYCEWKSVEKSLKQALRHRSAVPVRPPSHMERYAGSPLVRKLGFKPEMRVATLGLFEEIEGELKEVPEGLRFEPAIHLGTDLVLCVLRSADEMATVLEQLSVQLPPRASFWIIHPKQSGGIRSDFNQNDVRASALRAGFVDYKVCAVNADWSGLKFSYPRDGKLPEMPRMSKSSALAVKKRTSRAK